MILQNIFSMAAFILRFSQVWAHDRDVQKREAQKETIVLWAHTWLKRKINQRCK